MFCKIVQRCLSTCKGEANGVFLSFDRERFPTRCRWRSVDFTTWKVSDRLTKIFSFEQFTSQNNSSSSVWPSFSFRRTNKTRRKVSFYSIFLMLFMRILDRLNNMVGAGRRSICITRVDRLPRRVFFCWFRFNLFFCSVDKVNYVCRNGTHRKRRNRRRKWREN